MSVEFVLDLQVDRSLGETRSLAPPAALAAPVTTATDAAERPDWNLGGDLDLRRREHTKEISRQLAARLPELHPYDLPRARIEFPQARVGLLGDSSVRVVVLAANPSNVRLRVVVPIDSHSHRLASPPHGQIRATRGSSPSGYSYTITRRPAPTSQPARPLLRLLSVPF